MSSSASPVWAMIEYRPDGVYLSVRPGAPASAMAGALTELLQRGVPGVDFSSIQSAWASPSGLPVKVAPPFAEAPSPPSLEPSLRAEERDGEVFLTIAENAPPVSERDLVLWLTRRDYSGLDMDLVRSALTGPRGVPFQITRSEPPPTPRFLDDARVVVVADADEASRTRVAETLRARGVSVRPVGYGEMALFEVRQRAVDLVLLTHPLGREDGLALCQRLKAEPRAGGLAILAVCTQPTRDTVRRALECGANDILVRPWPTRALYHKVDSVLRHVGKKLPAGREGDANLAPLGEEVKTLGKIDVAKLCDTVARLQALPAVVERVLQLTSDPQTGARQLGLCIQSDPAVTAAVLKLANSALYGASGRIATVTDAVVRIGFLQTKSLVVGMSVIKMFGNGMRSAGFDRVLFWRHSIGVAVVAKLLAEAIRLGSPEVAFVAGLLHDVGKLLLDEYVPMEFSQAVASAIQGRTPLVEAETTALETSHVEVGAAALASWRFPEAIVTAVRRHHAPAPDEEKTEPGLRGLCDVVYAANLLAKATGHGHGGDLVVQEAPEGVWKRLGLRSGVPEDFWEKFRVEVARFEELLGFGAEVPAEFGGAGRLAVIHDAQHLPVSILATALESAGWRTFFARNPEDAASADLGRPDVVVGRFEGADALLAAMGAWGAAGTLSGVPLLGVLARGAPPPPETRTLCEPYDRSTLLDVLPPTDEAGPKKEG